MISRKTHKTIFMVKKNLSKKDIRKEIQKHCKKSVTVFTDEYTIYFNLKTHKMVKKHYTINHSKRQYAEGENHINTTENRHSLLRPFLNIFRGISKKNLNNYAKFFQYTFNNGLNWFKKALKTILNKRTTTRT